MGAKKKVNPRRGVVVAGAFDEPAKLKPGKAKAPKKFEAKDFAEEFDLWWMNGDGENYIRRDASGWKMLQSRALQDEAAMFFKDRLSFVARDEDYSVSQYRQMLMYVRDNRRVEELLKGLAGYPDGPHKVGGDLVLVKQGRVLPQPEEIEFPVIRALIDSRLSTVALGVGLEHSQGLLFDLWCKIAYEAQRDCKPGSPRRGHALVLVGDNGAGKSFLQEHLITPLLGGRQANPKMFLLGNDAYNSDVLGAEHLALGELAVPSSKSDAKSELKERMKELIANVTHRMRCMRTEPLSVAPNWAFSHSLNGNQDSIKNYPGLEPGFRDKILMLKLDTCPMPMPTTTEKEREAFTSKILEELPGYIDYLTKLEIPAELKVYADGKDATRFGFREFQHPTLIEQLSEMTPQRQLQDIIDSAWFVSTDLGMPASRRRVRLWDLPSPGNLDEADDKQEARLGEVNVSEVAGVWKGSYQWLQHLLQADKDGWNGWTCSAHKDFEKWLRYSPLLPNLTRLKEAEDNCRFDNGKCRQPRMVGDLVRTSDLRFWQVAAPNA
jgi:hypothetical protein